MTAVFEAAYGIDVPEVCPACAAPPDDDRPLVTSPEAAAAVLVPRLSGRDREACLALLLDTRHRLLEVETVSVGSIDHTFMSPREVFRDALLHGASAIDIAHNHPSGVAEPSAADRHLTSRLSEALKLIDVRVLDHLVIGDGTPYSFARAGLI